MIGNNTNVQVEAGFGGGGSTENSHNIFNILSPSVPAVAGRQLVTVRDAAYASDSGESLLFFLAGANKSYVIATSDL